MMTWVMDGKVNVISIADREKTEMEEGMLPLSTRNVYPSRFLAEVEKSATDILQNYIRYTGQTEGALSMQFSGNLAGAFRYVRLQDVSLDMNMS